MAADGAPAAGAASGPAFAPASPPEPGAAGPGAAPAAGLTGAEGRTVPSGPEQPAGKQGVAVQVEHTGWLTRRQVAHALGYASISPVRKMEGHGLHPIASERGWLFDPAEVARIKDARASRSRPTHLSEGQIASRVFQAFSSGKDLNDIVVELEVPPRIVRELWHEWIVGLEDGEAERLRTAKERAAARGAAVEETRARAASNREQREFERILAAHAASGDGVVRRRRLIGKKGYKRTP